MVKSNFLMMGRIKGRAECDLLNIGCTSSRALNTTKPQPQKQDPNTAKAKAGTPSVSESEEGHSETSVV